MVVTVAALARRAACDAGAATRPHTRAHAHLSHPSALGRIGYGWERFGERLVADSER